MHAIPPSGRRPLLTVGRSLFLLCIAYAVPFTAIICYQIIIGVGANMRFAQQEARGNAYLRPLLGLLMEVPEHRRAVVEGDVPGLRRTEATIQSGLQGLAEVQAEHGEALEFTSEGLEKRQRADLMPELVSARWSRIAAISESSDRNEVVREHDAFVTDLRRMIAHAGDTSNLILDPDLDSYYLMDVTLLALPQTIDRLAQIGAEVQDDAGGDAVSFARRLAVMGTQLKEADLDRVNSSSETALLEDANFYGTSPTFRERYAPQLDRYRQATEAVIQMMSEGAHEEGAFDLVSFSRRIADARAAALALWTVGVEELDVLLDLRIGSYRRAEYVGFSLTIAALLATSLVAWWLAYRVRKPLLSIATQLGTQAQEISSAASELTDASHTVANGASEQAALVERTGGTLRDLVDSSRDNSSTATEAASITRGAGETAARGLGFMQHLASSIQRIEVQSAKISDIVETIDGFAFRANLLALNAAVEAARAGEAGAGFAVVADEVRGLAKRINEASREIAGLIRENVEATHDAVRVCNETVATLESVHGTVNGAVAQVVRIHESSSHQEREVESVEKAIVGIEEVTQSNASGAEETASAAAELAAQSDELRRVLDLLSAFVGVRMLAGDESGRGPAQASGEPAAGGRRANDQVVALGQADGGAGEHRSRTVHKGMRDPLAASHG